eukprot:3407271-Rhodomonas_salina.3
MHTGLAETSESLLNTTPGTARCGMVIRVTRQPSFRTRVGIPTRVRTCALENAVFEFLAMLSISSPAGPEAMFQLTYRGCTHCAQIQGTARKTPHMVGSLRDAGTSKEWREIFSVP